MVEGPSLLREVERIWRCPFCRRSWRRRAKDKALAHLLDCFERPDRHPPAGALTTARSMGYLFLVEPQPDGEILTARYRKGEIPSDAWLEWKPRTMPAWWPGPGRVWSGWEWAAVPGWSKGHEKGPWRVDTEGAHGILGLAPPIDVWPELDGVPFDQHSPSARVLLAVRGKWR